MIVILVFVFSLMSVFVSSGVGMVCIGAAHSYDPRIPALGFPPVFFMVVAVYIVAMGMGSNITITRSR